MRGIAELIFGFGGLLVLVALVPALASRLRLPATVLLGVLGCGLGFASTLLVGGTSVPALLLDFLRGFYELPVTADIVLWVFLPLLLFETAMILDGRELLEELGPVLVLAILAVLISTAVAGLAVYGVTRESIVVCFMIAAIVATTDPSAVIAIFREVGAPRRLNGLVEGESLLNDAAAIAVFSAFVTMLLRPGRLDPLGAALGFVIEFIGGIAAGVVLGRLAGMLVSRLDQGGPAELTLSVALTYLTYAVSDMYLHVSGVVAVVAAGLTFGTAARSRLGAREWQNMTAIWSQLGFWASSLVFVLAATLIPNTLAQATWTDLIALIALIAGSLAARALTLFGVLPIVQRLGRHRPIDARYKLVIIWGGLRGAVTLALALAITENPRISREVQHLVSVLATGFVLVTLLVQGTTLRWLLRVLELDKLEPVEQLLRERVLAITRAELRDRISVAAIDYGLDLSSAQQLRELYPQLSIPSIAPNPADDNVRRDQLVAALATVTNREIELYVGELAEQMVSRRTGSILVRRAGALLDALKVEGVHGYRHEARRQDGFDWPTRLAAQLHWWTGLSRPLGARLTVRIEKLLVRRRVLEELETFAKRRIRQIFGARIAETTEHVLEARLNEVDRQLDGIRLQYPEHWQRAADRYLARVALALEQQAYERLFTERLLSPELFRNLQGEIRSRRRALEKIPRLDLGLDAERLMRRVPLFAKLPADQLAELRRMLRPRLALPGEIIVRRGEYGEAMFFIASGAVEVQLEPEPIRLGTGEFFGEIALLRREPRRANVVALSYSQLLMLRQDAFGQFLTSHRELAEEVQRVATARLYSNRNNAGVSRETMAVGAAAAQPKLLANAETREDAIEDLVDGDPPGDAAQRATSRA